MRFRFSNLVLVFSLTLFGVLSSCGKDGAALKPPPTVPGKSDAAAAPERISVAEIGKLRSRVGKEVIVSGKVSETSTSGSGHQFINFSNGFKIVCLKDDVAKFDGGGPVEIYAGKLIEARGEISSHQGKPQMVLQSPEQVQVIELDKGGGGAGAPAAKKFELIEIGGNIWVSPAGLRYAGRDAQGLTRKAHVLRHAKDQPERAGSHGVFDADGDEVFQVVDEAWGRIQQKRLRPQVEGDSLTYVVPMGRRIGYLGGKTGARRKHPPLSSVFIVIRQGTKDVVTAFPR